MAGTNSTFVITQESDLPIAVIVELDLLLHSDIGVFEFRQEIRHGIRGVVGTKDLCTKARHVAVQVFVELGSLYQSANISAIVEFGLR